MKKLIINHSTDITELPSIILVEYKTAVITPGIKNALQIWMLFWH